MRYPSQDNIIWQFNTANFRVICHAEPEDQSPADHFDDADNIAFAQEDDPSHWFCAFVSVWHKEPHDEIDECPNCEDGDNLYGRHNRMECDRCGWHGNDEDERALNYVAHDVLGGCSYNSFREFVSSHRSADVENRNTLAMKARKRVICHYFPGMVAQAIQEARKVIAGWQSIKLRA